MGFPLKFYFEVNFFILIIIAAKSLNSFFMPLLGSENVALHFA